jgi:hypothetical protein
LLFFQHSLSSALNRTRYVRNESHRESAVATLMRLGAGDLAYDVAEVSVIRDAIAHSHLDVQRELGVELQISGVHATLCERVQQAGK